MEFEKVTLPNARRIANMTQKELAEAVGVSESTVLNWEKGRADLTLQQAFLVSEVLGRPLDKIIFLPKNTVKP